MSTKKPPLVSLAIGITLLSACSALTGRPLKGAPPACTTNWLDQMRCEEPNAVPYALSRPHFSIQRKTLSDGKKARPVYEVLISYEADNSRRFEVGMSKGFLTNDTFELTLDTSGRAVSMNSSRADQTGKTIAGLITAGAAAAGVAARAAAMSETEGTAIVPGLCKWIDSELQPRDKERARLQAQDNLVQRSKDEALDPDIKERLAEITKRLADPANTADTHKQLANQLNSEITALKHEIEDLRCSSQEKCIGTVDPQICPVTVPPPHPCASRDDDCRTALQDVTRKARKLLSAKVCQYGTYVETETVEKPDPELAQVWTDIIAVEKYADNDTAAPDSDPGEQLARQLKRLRVRADTAVAEAALAKATGSPTFPAKQAAMQKAIDDLRGTVQIVLSADERLQTRRLEARRDLLLNFVAKKAPTGDGRGDTYAKYRAELDAVLQALTDILPKPGESPAALSDATAVTSTVDRGVLTERYLTPLTDEQLRQRISLAHTQVGLGCVQAIVLAAPDLTTESGERP